MRFSFGDVTQFSKGDSQEDFSVYSSTNMLNTNLANAHTFALDDEGYGSPYIRLLGGASCVAGRIFVRMFGIACFRDYLWAASAVLNKSAGTRHSITSRRRALEMSSRADSDQVEPYPAARK